MFTLDLANLGVGLYRVWKEDRELQAWIKLVLSLAFSGVISFLGVSGQQLYATHVWAVSVGAGFIASATSMLSVLLASPQGRSLVTSVPQSIIKDYQGGPNTTVTGKDVKL